MKRRLILAGLLVGALGTQAQLTISGQFRPRTELRNGFKKPMKDGDNPAVFTEQRSRLIFDYTSKSIETRFAVQDVRVWGETGQINKSDGLLSVHEAFAAYKFSDTSKIVAGRQALVYDDHRILGSLDWAMQGRSHDALRFIYNTPKIEVHLVGTFNQYSSSQEPANLQRPDATFYPSVAGAFAGTSDTRFQLPNPKTTQFVWLKKKGEGFSFSAIALNDGIQKDSSTIVWRQTIGLNPSLKASDLTINGSFYYQMGNANDSVTLGGLLASVTVAHEGFGSVAPLLGFDYLSGDDKSTTDAIEGFNPLYGTHHKFYGFMDYFYVGNGHNGGGNEMSGGLMDVYAQLTFKTKIGKILAHAHMFASPTTVYNPTDGSELGSYLGSEIDLVYVKPLTKEAVLKVGYSQLFNSESLDAAKGSYNATEGANIWAWAMLAFSPTFFTSGE